MMRSAFYTLFVVAVVAISTMALSADNKFESKSVRLGTLTATAGVYADKYIGPFDISECYAISDLVYGANKDSVLANPFVSFWLDYKTGDSMTWDVRAIATIYNTAPNLHQFDWTDSVGTNTKTAILLDDTVEAISGRGLAYQIQGSIADSVLLPYVWVEFAFDTTAGDVSVSGVIADVTVGCVERKEDTP